MWAWPTIKTFEVVKKGLRFLIVHNVPTADANFFVEFFMEISFNISATRNRNLIHRSVPDSSPKQVVIILRSDESYRREVIQWIEMVFGMVFIELRKGSNVTVAHRSGRDLSPCCSLFKLSRVERAIIGSIPNWLPCADQQAVPLGVNEGIAA